MRRDIRNGAVVNSIVYAPPRACYVHVPFCAHRCGYCDFTLIARRPDLVDDYLAALAVELATLSQPQTVDTLFFGGGTPTYLNADQLRRLCELLRRWMILDSGYEWSVEANPTDLTNDKLDVLREAGVNRISLGVQSFDAGQLKLLERDHDGMVARDAIARLRERFENVSLDLIFGVPGQTLEQWHATLEQAIGLGVQHISTYGLTFERGTQFWSKRTKGMIASVPEETERAMYEAAMDRLPRQGYQQYEISNFAQPGFVCRHNQTYWRAEPFYGFGPGAASLLRGVRRTNHRSVTTWIRRTLAGEPSIGEQEELDVEAAAREAVMLGLRQCRGIELTAFEQRFGMSLRSLAPEAYDHFVNTTLLECSPTHVGLTREGRCLADSVILEFL